MNVADLQQHLRDLAKLLQSAKAGKVPDELTAICDGLAPFVGLSLADFADFLRRADAYSRGELPPVPLKPTKRRGSGGRVKKVAIDVDALAAEVRALYERATDPTVTTEQIDETLRPLQGLKRAELVTVAEAIGYQVPKSKKVAEIGGEIRKWIETRRGSFQRAGMIHRPETATAQ